MVLNGFMVTIHLTFFAKTYKELLQTLADKSSENYTAYLQSKIGALIHTEDETLADKTQQYKDAAEYFEKKLVAAIAIVKNQEALNENVPEEDKNNFLK